MVYEWSMPAPRRAPEMTPELLYKCRLLVVTIAQEHDVPPVFITAHVRHRVADQARKQVWAMMLSELKMTRGQVAELFDRDRRRLTKSALGV